MKVVEKSDKKQHAHLILRYMVDVQMNLIGPKAPPAGSKTAVPT